MKILEIIARESATSILLEYQVYKLEKYKCKFTLQAIHPTSFRNQL
ncbi:MAG: hypothetical protein ACTSWN_14310 [Promethearchaeota archaeon]